ncbi:MAG: hypothetical protein JWN04_3044 [Myxococcaceae bacterium]|nr:hypothetical protein [Myxococcaceae bacterium]
MAAISRERIRPWVELGVFDDTATVRTAPFDAIELEAGRLFLPKEADGEA